MSRKSQIWYRKGSAAASLAETLKNDYEVVAFSSDDSEIAKADEGSASLRVFLIDAEIEPSDRLRRLRLSDAHARIVGVIPASPNAPSKSPLDPDLFFAYVPSGASTQELKKTIAIAFENIELVERARSSGEALEVAERERQQLNEIGVALSSERDIDALLTLILKKRGRLQAPMRVRFILLTKRAAGGVTCASR